jgi:hypothetical protein
MLEVLAAAGFNEEEALRTYATFHTYTIGFAALEASRSNGNQPASASMRMCANFPRVQQSVSSILA